MIGNSCWQVIAHRILILIVNIKIIADVLHCVKLNLHVQYKYVFYNVLIQNCLFYEYEW